MNITLKIAARLLLVLATACGCTAAIAAPDKLQTEWRFLGGNSDGWQFSPLREINDSNAGQLGLAWYTDLPSLDGLVGNPLVVDGIIYQGGPLGHIYANDVRTGKSLWVHTPELKFADSTAFVAYWASHFNRGVAVDNDRVYIGAICDLIAVDRRTGKQVWRSQSCDPTQQNGITAAPVVGAGKVFIGNAGGDISDTRGFVDAFDAATGKHLWRFYSMPGDPQKPFENKAMQMASKTWGRDYWKYTHGGLHVWDAVTYDEKLNQVYLGTDCPKPEDPKERAPDAGDELFACAIVALNADTGDYVWHVSTVLHSDNNLDAGRVMVADLPIGGGNRHVVLAAPKNGFFYTIDAKSGEVISANNYLPVTWASRIEIPSGRPVVIPKDPNHAWVQLPTGHGGAHLWHAMAFNPQLGLVYIPAIQLVDTFSSPDTPELEALKAKYKNEGKLIAWDPVAQKERWHVHRDIPFNGGVLTTAGNVVFQGTSDGLFQAFAADSGKLLWSFDAHSVTLAAPTTVEVGAEQLVIVPVGNGGATVARQVATLLYGDKGTFAPSRLLAFKLGGKADFPRFVPSPMPKPVRAPQPAELAAKGGKLFAKLQCGYCHGRYAVGAGPGIPDLRKMSMAAHNAMADIVIGGLYQPLGMPAFRNLPKSDLEAIRAYVIDEGWAAYDKQNLSAAQGGQKRP
jgi:PQQ-dependent dehydrogenase (methanol/ethanol family)